VTGPLSTNGAQAVVTTSTLQTQNEIPPVLASSPEHILGDPAPLPPYTGEDSPFTFSIPYDGETWSQDINDNEDDSGGFELANDCLGEEVRWIPL
jgi:hypothetical protein